MRLTRRQLKRLILNELNMMNENPATPVAGVMGTVIGHYLGKKYIEQHRDVLSSAVKFMTRNAGWRKVIKMAERLAKKEEKTGTQQGIPNDMMLALAEGLHDAKGILMDSPFAVELTVAMIGSAPNPTGAAIRLAKTYQKKHKASLDEHLKSFLNDRELDRRMPMGEFDTIRDFLDVFAEGM